MLLDNTAAIVTGAASGLGNATARGLAAAGATVFGFDLPQTVASLEEREAGITYLGVDVTDTTSVATAVQNVIAAAGPETPLRTVVNCAGIGTAGRIYSGKGMHDLEAFATVVNVNLVGTFHILAIAASEIAQTPELEDGQRGVIVNTASIAAFDGQIGQVAYAASKGGVVGMTLPAARDLAQYGIRVNTIAPGIVETPMLASVSDDFRAGLAAGVPFPKRLARPEEYAQLVLDVVDHDYLNGETLRMDGALRMAPR